LHGVPPSSISGYTTGCSAHKKKTLIVSDKISIRLNVSITTIFKKTIECIPYGTEKVLELKLFYIYENGYIMSLRLQKIFSDVVT
jgi:hypothetical protein